MAGIDILTYAVSRKYTDETVAQFGGVKGAPCKVKSIDKNNGVNTVTFEWKNDAGETRESTMKVLDGTPIYVWTSGDSYKYGDLVIYASCFYRCITPNSDIEFDDRKWNEIGSPDGNYDIVQNSELLPPIFTEADRKMYYSIEENIFYLWNGYQWEPQNTLVQHVTMPIAKRILRGRIVQYVGDDTEDFKNGHFYKCVLNEEDRYVWEIADIAEQTNSLTREEMDNLLHLLNNPNYNTP